MLLYIDPSTSSSEDDSSSERSSSSSESSVYLKKSEEEELEKARAKWRNLKQRHMATTVEFEKVSKLYRDSCEELKKGFKIFQEENIKIRAAYDKKYSKPVVKSTQDYLRPLAAMREKLDELDFQFQARREIMRKGFEDFRRESARIKEELSSLLEKKKDIAEGVRMIYGSDDSVFTSSPPLNTDKIHRDGASLVMKHTELAAQKERDIQKLSEVNLPSGLEEEEEFGPKRRRVEIAVDSTKTPVASGQEANGALDSTDGRIFHRQPAKIVCKMIGGIIRERPILFCVYKLFSQFYFRYLNRRPSFKCGVCNEEHHL